MSEESEKANWMIKDMPVISRKKASGCAVKRGETMAVWMGRAIDNQAALEAGDKVFMPGEKPELPVKPLAAAPDISPEQILALAQSEKLISEASGTPMSKASANHLRMLLQGQYRAKRGLAPLKVRQPPQQPQQTIEHDAPPAS